MTKIKIINDHIIFDGHADTKQECEIATLVSNLLSSCGSGFNIIDYREGYAEFIKSDCIKLKDNQLKFIPNDNSVTINFDEHITKVVGTVDGTEFEWTTSGQTQTVSNGESVAVLCTVYFDGQYKIGGIDVGTVTGDNTFILSSGSYGSDVECTITSKSSAKQKIILSDLDGWKNLSDGEHVITIKTKATGYVDSAFSNSVTAIKPHTPVLTYYGLGTELSEVKFQLGSASVGNYALFAGGNYGLDSVDAYDTNLTKTIPTALSTGRGNIGSASIGNYALFAGGQNSYLATVDAYDTSLTRTTPTTLSVARAGPAAAVIGNYALFAGGNPKEVITNRVDAYDTSLTRTLPTALSVARKQLAGAGNANYALFGGGDTNGSDSSVVDAYDSSLTRTIPISLSSVRYGLSAVQAGNYVLFSHGLNDSGAVNAYDLSLTRTLPADLPVGGMLGVSTLDSYGIFSNGKQSYIYNQDLVLSTVNGDDESKIRSFLGGAVAGNYVLFAGGRSDFTTHVSTVNVYLLS